VGRRAKVKIDEIKNFFKLYEKKGKLERDLETLWNERDRISSSMAILFLIAIAIFVFSILVGGLLLLREEQTLHKILGGFFLGIPIGMLIYLCASSKWDILAEKEGELDRKIGELKKEIRQIEKEVIGE